MGEIKGTPTVVTADLEGEIRIWHLQTGDQIHGPLRDPGGHVKAVAIGQRHGQPILVTAVPSERIDFGSGRLRIWDANSGEQIEHDLVATHFISALATGRLTSGEPVAVSGGNRFNIGGQLQIWDLATFQPIGTPWKTGEGTVTAVTVGDCSGRSCIISGDVGCYGGNRFGDGGTLQRWDLDTRQPIGSPLPGRNRDVSAVTVGHRNGQPVIISATGGDGAVQVWLEAGDEKPLTLRIDLKITSLALWNDFLVIGTETGFTVVELGASLRP